MKDILRWVVQVLGCSFAIFNLITSDILWQDETKLFSCSTMNQLPLGVENSIENYRNFERYFSAIVLICWRTFLGQKILLDWILRGLKYDSKIQWFFSICLSSGATRIQRLPFLLGFTKESKTSLWGNMPDWNDSEAFWRVPLPFLIIHYHQKRCR